jgi:hypothetical protein
VIGRALVLSKLEEAAMLRATTSKESFVGIKCSYVDAVGAFDKRMADVIYQWRRHLEDAESESWKTQNGCDGAMDMVVSKVTRYMETFKAKEVELSPERKRKQEAKNDDVWKLEDKMKDKKRRIDKEVGTCGTIVFSSEMRCTCSRVLAMKDCVEDLGARRSKLE